MLGEYEPLSGHGHFWARAPKLRQQIEIARISEDQAKLNDDSSATNIEGAAKMATLAIFVEEYGKTRQATYDEVLDEFDAAEISNILQKYLGLGTADNADPNAV